MSEIVIFTYQSANSRKHCDLVVPFLKGKAQSKNIQILKLLAFF